VLVCWVPAQAGCGGEVSRGTTNGSESSASSTDVGGMNSSSDTTGAIAAASGGATDGPGSGDPAGTTDGNGGQATITGSGSEMVGGSAGEPTTVSGSTGGAGGSMGADAGMSSTGGMLQPCNSHRHCTLGFVCVNTGADDCSSAGGVYLPATRCVDELSCGWADCEQDPNWCESCFSCDDGGECEGSAKGEGDCYSCQ
jgi:hypothetical protein